MPREASHLTLFQTGPSYPLGSVHMIESLGQYYTAVFWLLENSKAYKTVVEKLKN